MRIDDFLSTVGIIKRRTIAKELASNGMIAVNGHTVKAAYTVKPNDVIQIKGARPFSAEVLAVPTRSIAKDERDKYFRELPGH